MAVKIKNATTTKRSTKTTIQPRLDFSTVFFPSPPKAPGTVITSDLHWESIITTGAAVEVALTF